MKAVQKEAGFTHSLPGNSATYVQVVSVGLQLFSPSSDFVLERRFLRVTFVYLARRRMFERGNTFWSVFHEKPWSQQSRWIRWTCCTCPSSTSSIQLVRYVRMLECWVRRWYEIHGIFGQWLSRVWSHFWGAFSSGFNWIKPGRASCKPYWNKEYSHVLNNAWLSRHWYIWEVNLRYIVTKFQMFIKRELSRTFTETASTVLYCASGRVFILQNSDEILQ